MVCASIPQLLSFSVFSYQRWKVCVYRGTKRTANSWVHSLEGSTRSQGTDYKWPLKGFYNSGKWPVPLIREVMETQRLDSGSIIQRKESARKEASSVLPREVQSEGPWPIPVGGRTGEMKSKGPRSSSTSKVSPEVKKYQLHLTVKRKMGHLHGLQNPIRKHSQS